MENEVLQKYIEGNASEQEALAIVEWLDKDTANFHQYLLLRRIYEATLWHNPQKVEPREKRIKNIFKECLKVAAVFAVGAFSFFVYERLTRIENKDFLMAQKIVVPERQRAEVDLSDGSKVWINAKSILTLAPESSDKVREIFLEGEAYFDIAHDENKKFIVNTENYQMKVFGTQFNVKSFADKNYFEVGLVEGSLEVSSKMKDEKILLQPSESVSAYNGENLSKMTLDTDNYLWKEGILYFNEQTVSEIFEKLEQYFDVEINVTNTDILSQKFTGKFWINDGIEQVLSVLQLSQKFEYTKQSKGNKLTINIL